MQTISFGFLKDDYLSFLYLLQGYLRIYAYPSKNRLCPIQEIKSMLFESLNSKLFSRKLSMTKQKISGLLSFFFSLLSSTRVFGQVSRVQ